MDQRAGLDPAAGSRQRDLSEGGPLLSPSQATVYRRLAIGDEVLLDRLLGRLGGVSEPMDRAAASLVRIAALIMCDASIPAYLAEVRHALDSGASSKEITAVLVTVAPIAGSSLVISAAPKLAIALGYDVDAALEGLDPGRER